ncbi:DNA cytosine methyltransferase [Pseudomonas sp.]|uniref:DNA cytosine methyltransferase n=1 Tax=Pseudomonas sp. TaxID=306 RepID=UPI0025893412|nr:DNA cytosine methyltransferase [Pseudomonas sp.]
MNITYGSVCSGIEAASVAWEPLGFVPQWFSEIEAFPAAVLAHHWPHVTNLGDMTKIAERIRSGEIEAPDVLVGGTPCQAFSVAGARKGLADERGQLTISYGELADAIDDTRTAAGKPESIIVWENVPGVLSSKDNAFGAFLGLLAGEECELQPPGGKWKNAGYVRGPKRILAWIVKDAQFFGVAQRRRRVFVVASARADFDPAKVLFEPEGVCRDTPPSRSPRQVVAALTANGVGTCGADDNQGQAGHLIAAFGGGNCSGPIDVATACTAHGVRMDFDTETFLAQCVTGNISHTLKAEGFDGSEDGTGRGTPIVNTFSSTGKGSWAEGCGTLRAREQESHEHLAVMAVHGTQDPDTNVELAHTLGRNHGQENAVYAFSSKDHGQDAAEEISPTLRAGGHSQSHANAGAPPAVAYGFQPRIARNGRGDMGDVCHALTAEAGETGKGDSAPHVAYCLQHAQIGLKDSAGPQGKGWQEEVGFTLDSRSSADAVAVAFAENSRAEVRLEGGDGQIVGALSTGGGKPGQGYPTIARKMAVRRLTPVECERLQGFPDCWTAIPTDKRKKITEDELAYIRHHFPEITEEEAQTLAADGPRYKAIGNSMAVPCMSFIGKRIKQQLEGAM